MYLVSFFFFVSGFCALLYQTVWFRLAMANFGVNAPVVSSVLALFMMGLALGSYFGGRMAQHLMQYNLFRGLRLYAFVEITIAVGALAVPALLHYGRIWILGLSMADPLAYFSASFLMIFIALIPFCFAMGATYPVALSYLEKVGLVGHGADFSRLYLVNVLGSILGTFLSAFLFIEMFGFKGTLLIAMTLNLVVAGFAFIASKKSAVYSRSSKAEYASKTKTPPALLPASALILLFFLGMSSLGLEVIWARIYVPYSGTEVYAFANILAVYLLATAAGTFFYRSCFKWYSFEKAWFLWVLLAPLAGMAFYSAFPGLALSPYMRIFLGIAPISFVSGMLTPFLIDSTAKSAPIATGIAYAANLLGCIVGPILTGFVLIPFLGNHVACFVWVVVLWLLSVKTFVVSDKAGFKINAGIASIGIISLVFSVVLFLLGGTFEMYFKRGRIFHDHTSTVVVAGEGMDKLLIVNGQSMTRLTTITKMMAHLPLAHLTHPPENGLVVCLGMGTTFRSIASWDINTTVVELTPSVAKVFPYYFADANEILARKDIRARIVVDDGRRFLDRTAQMFDVIAVDPPPPVTAAASSLLYSKEFYETAKRRLRKDGILQTWIPGGDRKMFSSVLEALLESFPHVRQFPSIEGWGFHFLASESEIRKRSAQELVQVMPEKARKDLSEWIKQSPEEMFQAILSREVNPRQFLHEIGSLSPAPLTDDRPYNEYYWIRFNVKKWFDSMS